MKITRIKSSIQQSIEVKQHLLADQQFLGRLTTVIEVIVSALGRGNKILLAGNGGSAADAQHIAAEFVSRLEFNRPGLSAVSLATDTSILTAIGNDYGYDQLFSRQLKAQSRPGDAFIGITTSGRSGNILSGFNVCRELGLVSIALCGLGGDFDNSVDHVLRVPSSHTPRVQESHILIGHLICTEVELEIFGHLESNSR
jgi:D-sedoheptulose 7-phosphate isomerase